MAHCCDKKFLLKGKVAPPCEWCDPKPLTLTVKNEMVVVVDTGSKVEQVEVEHKTDEGTEYTTELCVSDEEEEKYEGFRKK